MLTNIKKVYKKKLVLLTKEDEDQEKLELSQKMDIDINSNGTNTNNNLPNQTNISTNNMPELIQNMLEWKNEAHKKKVKNVYHGETDFDKISNQLIAIEDKVSEYLKINDKEWEFSDIRANWVN